jgi:benzoyl-CoA-dihydrodiol lyase
MGDVVSTAEALQLIDYRTQPDRYLHWRLFFDGPVATLAMDIDEDKACSRVTSPS